MPHNLNRRCFLRKSVIATTAAALSLEEKILLAKQSQKTKPARMRKDTKSVPMGKIGKVKISRLICGGNLINGYAHSRDLIYVSSLLKHYFTQEKIMETWRICEEHGINTAVLSNCDNDREGVKILNKYWNQHGGKIQWIAQCQPQLNDLTTNIQRAADNGAVGAFILGNVGDLWVKNDRVDLLEKTIEFIKSKGLIAGIGGHSINVPIACETAQIEADFYCKTLHSSNYWSARRPGQFKNVIDNYDVDNYWSMTPKETIELMKEVKKPWIAYKVLAAGAVHPQEGFKFALENGADFINVGMYDFQISEDARIARQLLSSQTLKNRPRPWMA
ncbi:MAG: hypothetical protein ACYSTJ_07985 [Planctomycetota bacterium]|jgi:hypothetical protein